MANIWTDTWQNNENSEHIDGNAKGFLSARKHSTRKQAFGELKNVIHNQGGATPFRDAKAIKTFPGHGKPFLCADVIRKQQLNQNHSDAQKRLEKKFKQPSVNVKSNSELTYPKVDLHLDDLELPVNTCSGDCIKSVREIWNEMNTIDEDFLNKVIRGGDPDSDEELQAFADIDELDTSDTMESVFNLNKSNSVEIDIFVPNFPLPAEIDLNLNESNLEEIDILVPDFPLPAEIDLNLNESNLEEFDIFVPDFPLPAVIDVENEDEIK